MLIFQSGLVLCGLLGAGTLHENDDVQIGPDSSGNYRLAKIKTLRRNKQPVLKIHTGETASISIEFSTNMNFVIKKGMVVVSKHDYGICCRKFIARFKLISHFTDEISLGFQGMGLFLTLFSYPIL
jgi:GTPase